MRVSLARQYSYVLCAHLYRYCAKGGATNICTNKQLHAAKAKNEIPNFSYPIAVPAGATGLPKKVKAGAVPSV